MTQFSQQNIYGNHKNMILKGGGGNGGGCEKSQVTLCFGWKGFKPKIDTEDRVPSLLSQTQQSRPPC